MDCVLVAIGGGGLIAGVASALKQLNSQIQIIGVEPEGAPSMYYSLQAGHLVDLPDTCTIADTLSTRTVCERTLALTQRYMDEIVLVNDSQIIQTMRWLWGECNQLVEPSGAAALAAALFQVADLTAYQHPVAVICGGNASAEPVWQVYAEQARMKGTLP